MPMFNRMDLSLIQDIFRNIGGKRNAGQIRARHHELRQPAEPQLGREPAHWSCPTPQPTARRSSPTPRVDAQGRATYRLAVVNNELVNESFQTNTALGDVYQFMLSFRYSFN